MEFIDLMLILMLNVQVLATHVLVFLVKSVIVLINKPQIELQLFK